MARSSDVTLSATGFAYKGCDYPYSQVTSLYFFCQVTDVRVMGMHRGNRHDASLDIVLQGCPAPIKVRTGFCLTLFSDEYKLSEVKTKEIISLHRGLASATFSFRLRRYAEMLQEH